MVRYSRRPRRAMDLRSHRACTLIRSFVLLVLAVLFSAIFSGPVLSQDVYFCQKCGKYHLVPASVQYAQSASVVQSWGSGYALQVAIQSATYRAQKGIKGHSVIDLRSGRRNGVGWASHNSAPATCYWAERNRGAYASVRGRDGWYSALVF